MSAQPVALHKLPRWSIEQITPEVAEHYLKANRSNRPISRGIVAGYVEAMRAGDWLLNGESIKFDWDGRLVDGQHRLAAIVAAKRAIAFGVIRDLDPEVFKTLDIGKKRTAADVLAIRHVYNPNAVAIACRLLYRTLQRELARKERITNTKLDALVAQHPRLVDLAVEADHTPFGTPLVNAGQRMFGFYMAVHVHEQKAREFFRALSGHPSPTDRAQPNAVRLRERLTSTMDEIVKPSTAVRLAWLIEAWNATAAAKEVGRFGRIVTEIPDWSPMPKFGALRGG